MSAKRRGYFEGWYYKQQSGGHTLALIPGRSDDGAFVQVITENDSLNVPFELREYRRDGERIVIGKNEFSPDGVRLDMDGITGELRYSGLTPIHGDIMGPFRFFPMECRHGICSMLHRVDGNVTINGTARDFTGGRGYIESDSGSSFPSGYMWVQCNDFAVDCSIVASVARIPFAGVHFWGCIAVVWLGGREYRLATYSGVRIMRCGKDRLILRQGRLCLDIELGAYSGHSLYAPRQGSMSRTIRESAQCTARFRFSESGRVLFDESSEGASCEYVEA